MGFVRQLDGAHCPTITVADSSVARYRFASRYPRTPVRMWDVWVGSRVEVGRALLVRSDSQNARLLWMSLCRTVDRVSGPCRHNQLVERDLIEARLGASSLACPSSSCACHPQPLEGMAGPR